MRRFATTFGVAVVFACCASKASTAATVMLPIEVVGENGATAGAAVDVPPGRAREVRSLWMQIHGLGYADMVSVQVNAGSWMPLNNNSVAVAEPGKSYGGIGGGYSTLKVTLALPPDAIVDGANTIRFRFNRSDGVVSGFRVVALNLLTASSVAVLDPTAFAHDDPATWTPPLRDAESVRAGQEAWLHAPLKASSLPNATTIRAHCSDCHAQDGRDLKYFAFSNASIVARSRFHGLSELQGQQIASYIRTRSVPSPGRPWNPPYQPGPGLDAQPVANWAAGAGLSWALDRDTASLPFMLAANGGTDDRMARDAAAPGPDWNAIVPLISHRAFHPDGNMNPREIPIALQLPDWNHWLPRVHPIDAWGPAFQNSDFARLYDGAGGSKPSLRATLASPDLSAAISSGRIVTSFEKWTNARRAFLKSYVEGGSVSWSADLALKAYSTQLWQLVKTWEVTQEFGLEGRGRDLFGESGETRTWLNAIPAATAPAAVNIPDGPSGMGGSALTNEYFDASWYQLQVLLNSGNHRHRGRLPVDWIYLVGKFQDLYNESHRAEPARLLITVIKAMQSTDPRIGPDDVVQGWRPGQNVAPTILVDTGWMPMFEPLSTEAKRAITEALLVAWLDKNKQYPIGRYFHVGLSEASYALPASYASLAGGKVWESAPLFTAAGVNPGIVKQLTQWGASYSTTAARFQYSPGGNSRSKPPDPKKKSGQ